MKIFRKITFLFLFVFSSALFIHAQEEIEKVVSQKISDVFARLSQENISTGILHDKAISFVRIEEFDGKSFSKICRLKDWKQIYLEMFNSFLSKPSMEELKSINHKINQFRDRKVYPLGVINFDYNKIKTDAFERGMLKDNNGVIEYIDGEPFEERSVFAVTALIEKTYRGSSVEFLYSDEFYFSNKTQKIELIEIDFADGFGFRKIIPGVIHINYSSPGVKNIRVIAHYENGSINKSSFYFNVIELDTPQPHETWTVTADIPYLGEVATGHAFIYRSDLNSTLTNPVLIVAGFDSGNDLGWDGLYNLLNQENLIEDIRSYGYDAVVFNLDSTNYFVQRNSFAVVKLIQMVNSMIGTSKISVIVGASMGGLLVRYALCYMETNGLDHNIEKFISFDSPQNGANIPLGLQYFAAFFASQSADGQEILDMLNGSAARQMLVYHYSEPAGTTGVPDPLFTELQNELDTLGDYPQDVELVSIINGSGAAQNQGYNATDQVIQYEYDSFLVDITGNVWAVPDNTSHIIFDGLIQFLGMPADDQTVIVNSTKPYDNAPGGNRSSFADLDSMDAPYGDIIALHDNHGYIPTVSALDADTENLFYNFSLNTETVSTPFDRIYFPAENQEHMTITEESAGWFLDEIVGISNVSIISGWNIISVPLHAKDMRTTSLFPTAVSNAFSYDGAYIAKDTLEFGKGYWLKFPSSDNIEIKGVPVSGNISVSAGWNIVGPFNTNVAVSDIATNPAGILTSNFFEYYGAYLSADTLKPGKGYWIKASANGELILTPLVNRKESSMERIFPQLKSENNSGFIGINKKFVSKNFINRK
ncbi:MAG: hypothetical protein V1720_04535 [bacterium]